MCPPISSGGRIWRVLIPGDKRTDYPVILALGATVSSSPGARLGAGRRTPGCGGRRLIGEAGRPARLTVGPLGPRLQRGVPRVDAGNPEVRAGARPGRGPARPRPGAPVADRV